MQLWRRPSCEVWTLASSQSARSPTRITVKAFSTDAKAGPGSSSRSPQSSETEKASVVGSKLDRVSRPHPTIDKMIRVNQAGEFGANRIYSGQAAVLGNTDVGPLIQHMWDQEKEHQELFDRLVRERRVRPTALMPLWNIAGFILGASTALLGKEGAMACTVAVEDAIVDHYNSQLRELLNTHLGDDELLQGISKCRDDEQEHKDIGLNNDAELAPVYSTLSEVIKGGCKVAIWLSERL